jgi:hypothetical protein
MRTDPVAQLARTAQALLVRGSRLESTGGSVRIESEALRRAVEQQIREAAVERAVGFGSPADTISDATQDTILEAPGGASPLDVRAAAAEVVAGAERALDRIAGGESPSRLSDHEVLSLEAIVLVVGRPAMRLPGGRVEMPLSGLRENEHWRVFVATARSKINRAAASVARVALDNPEPGVPFAGTAWRIGADLLVTNRHVAKHLAENSGDSPGSWRLAPTRTAFVDFAVTDAPASPQRFAVAELVFCAVEESVDFAVLRLDLGGGALPPPLALDLTEDALGRNLAPAGGRPGAFQGTEVYVVGHPHRHLPSQASQAVFGQADGRKRCSPGKVTAVSGDKPTFSHDSSTLGGNSGSCVLAVETHAVVGLHYAGLDVDSSGRGTTNLGVALSRLGSHRAAAILRGGGV